VLCAVLYPGWVGEEGGGGDEGGEGGGQAGGERGAGEDQGGSGVSRTRHKQKLKINGYSCSSCSCVISKINDKIVPKQKDNQCKKWYYLIY